jgi:hypothetical protein
VSDTVCGTIVSDEDHYGAGFAFHFRSRDTPAKGDRGLRQTQRA